MSAGNGNADTGGHVAIYDEDGKLRSSTFITTGTRLVLDDVEIMLRQDGETPHEFRKRAIALMFAEEARRKTAKETGT